MANKIKAGTVWVNDHASIPAEMPWGGFKDSGFGNECSVLTVILRLSLFRST